MIKLMFKIRNQFFTISIENKRVFYWDKMEGAVWGGPLQYLPPDPQAIRRIDMSRNKIPQDMKELLKVTKEELMEYQNAKDDEELKTIVLRDTKRHGCELIKEMRT